MAELKLVYLNLVLLVGRMVDDPHPLSGKDDTPGAAFTLACNRWVKGKTVSTTYADCICWGDTAKAVIASCGKGSPILITGSLANYNKTRGKVEVKVLQVSVQSCQFLASRPKDDHS